MSYKLYAPKRYNYNQWVMDLLGHSSNSISFSYSWVNSKTDQNTKKMINRIGNTQDLIMVDPAEYKSAHTRYDRYAVFKKIDYEYMINPLIKNDELKKKLKIGDRLLRLYKNKNKIGRGHDQSVEIFD